MKFLFVLQIALGAMGAMCLMALAANTTVMAQKLPHTDPDNAGDWILNTSISDEFDAEIDESKWQICGRDGVFWKGSDSEPGFTGRGYGKKSHNTGWEFSPENLCVEDGTLRIKAKHDPKHKWVNNPEGFNFEYTTGGMYSKSTIAKGYIEVRCILPKTGQVCAFWTTGRKAELDVFEAIGKHTERADLMWSSVHDWKLPLPNSSWTQTTQLPFKFSDGFHTYAAEWDESSVKIFADGKLVHSVTREWIEIKGQESKRWPLDVRQHVWLDSEIFPWWAKPDPESLPAEFEVDYVRVWEKKVESK
jgi:beta-glucanase (GH16 family)